MLMWKPLIIRVYHSDCFQLQRYTTFFLEEALRAASTGRFERLFWLTDRWPAVLQQAPSSWYGIGEADEGVLHLACRATAHRCVELCLQRKVGERVPQQGFP